MKPWVKKKITEYIGDEEQAFIDFICKKLVERITPHQLAEHLALVLEDEATDFVIKLWRMLIFNILTTKSEMKAEIK
jgi:RNA-binding protein 25